MTQSPALPERAADTSADRPWPVRLLSLKIGDYVDKMSPVWIEGQIVQLSRRDRTAYLVLRDADVDISLNVTIATPPLDAAPVPLGPGSRVVVHAKAVFWQRRGQLTLDARSIRPVGVGDLLARIELLKAQLGQEGLFDPRRKKPLPFIPRGVGLITGRDSAAERDVVDNARRRWPFVRFVVRNVAVQGPNTVEDVCRALATLDADRSIDVIVIARGGGSIEELLPFSNETLVRAVSRAATPIVSAIGHEQDTPLLDLVADWRASTPTDAAKRIVPDAAEERRVAHQAATRAHEAMRRRIEHERRLLRSVMTRPVMAAPTALLDRRRAELAALTTRSRTTMHHRLTRAGDDIVHLAARVRALSPQSTLDRGYAVVQHVDGRVVMDRADVQPDDLLRVRVARGDFAVRPVVIGGGEDRGHGGELEPHDHRNGDGGND